MRTGIAVVTILIIAFLIGSWQWNKIRTEYQIEYAQINYSFARGIEIESLSWNTPDTQGELSYVLLNMGIWNAIFGSIYVDEIALENGFVNFADSGQEPSDSNLSFGLNKGVIHQVSLQYISSADTFSVSITDLEIDDFAYGDEINLMSLTGDDIGVLVSTQADSTETAPIENYFVLLPNLEIGLVDIHDLSLELNQGDKKTTAQVSFKIEQWEKDGDFQFSVDTLYGVFADTIDFAFHLGASSWNEDDQIVLVESRFKMGKSEASIQNLAFENFNQPIVDLQGTFVDTEIGELEYWMGSLDGILNPEFPRSNRVILKGDYQYTTNLFEANHAKLWLTDTTFMGFSCAVSIGEDQLNYEVEIADLNTSRSDLKAILYPQSFYDMYDWPPILQGNVEVVGDDSNIAITGLLETSWGDLDLLSEVDLSDSAQVVYRLDIKSKAANLYKFAPYITVPIRQAEIDLHIAGIVSDSTVAESFLLDISANKMHVDSFEIDSLAFRYWSNIQYDSLLVYANDSLVMLDIAGAISGEDTTIISWDGEVRNLNSTFAKGELPIWNLNTFVSGNYKSKDDFSQVNIALRSLQIIDQNETSFADLEISFTQADSTDVFEIVWGENLQVNGMLQGSFSSGQRIFSKEFFAELPDFNLDLSANIDSSFTSPFLYEPLELIVADCKIINQAENKTLTGSATIRSIDYSQIRIQDAEFNFQFDDGKGTANLSVSETQIQQTQLTSTELSFSSTDVLNNWKLEIQDIEDQGLVKIGIVENKGSDGFTFRIDESDSLVFFDRRQAVFDNTGILLDPNYKLEGGNLSFGSAHGSFEFETSKDEVVNVKIDSLNVGKILNPFIADFETEGLLNANVDYDLKNGNGHFGFSIYHLMADAVPLGIWKGDGAYEDNILEANLNIIHDSVQSNIHLNYDNELVYSLELNDFNLVTIAHFLPEDIRLTGFVDCNLNGTYDQELKQDGWLSFHGASIVLPELYTEYAFGEERIGIHDEKMVFEAYSIYDLDQNKMEISGNLDLYPKLNYNLKVLSEKFSFVDNRSGKGIEGKLLAAVDLKMNGSSDKHVVFGTIDVFSGGNIRYALPDKVSEPDKLGDLEFVSFAEVQAQNETLNKKEQSTFFANLNIDISLENTDVDIILNEVTQEFVSVFANGNVKIRKKGFNQMEVFGEIQSTEGQAYISLPAISSIQMDIESAAVEWNGPLSEPLISMLGSEKFNSSLEGLSGFSNEKQIVPVTAEIIIEKSLPSKPELHFGLRSSNPELKTYLNSQPPQNIDQMATNLLIFGTLSQSGSKGKDMAMNGVSKKLNELSHRNLKYTDLSFSVDNSNTMSTYGTTISRSELEYRLKQRLLNDRLTLYLSGALFSSSEYENSLPPSQIVGNFGASYLLGSNSYWSLQAERNTSYAGIIDGEVTQYKLGFKFTRSFVDFRSFFSPVSRKKTEINIEDASDD